MGIHKLDIFFAIFIITACTNNSDVSRQGEIEYKKNSDIMNEAISEDLKDQHTAREWQNSYNPLMWFAGKAREEYNKETLDENIKLSAALQYSEQLSIQNELNNKTLLSDTDINQRKAEIIKETNFKHELISELFNHLKLTYAENRYKLLVINGKSPSQETYNNDSKSLNISVDTLKYTFNKIKNEYQKKQRFYEQDFCMQSKSSSSWSNGIIKHGIWGVGANINEIAKKDVFEKNKIYLLLKWTENDIKTIQLNDEFININNITYGKDSNDNIWKITSPPKCI